MIHHFPNLKIDNGWKMKFERNALHLLKLLDYLQKSNLTYLSQNIYNFNHIYNIDVNTISVSLKYLPGHKFGSDLHEAQSSILQCRNALIAPRLWASWAF